MPGKVKRRTLGPDGKTAHIYREDPRPNSMKYDVEFPDGLIKYYSANMIAENMLMQIDFRMNVNEIDGIDCRF